MGDTETIRKYTKDDLVIYQVAPIKDTKVVDLFIFDTKLSTSHQLTIIDPNYTQESIEKIIKTVNFRNP